MASPKINFREGIKNLSTILLIVFLFLGIIFLVFVVTSKIAYANDFFNISGNVFEDLNVNNSKDIAERGLAGWQVNLYQDNNLIKSTLTTTDGDYLFSNLAAGNYKIELVIKARWQSVSDNSYQVNLNEDNVSQFNFSAYQIIDLENQGIGPLPFMTLSNVRVISVSETSATIIWFTSHQASSQLIFGKVSLPNDKLIFDSYYGYQFSSKINFKEKTYHLITLNNLEPETDYFFRAVSLPSPKIWRKASALLSDEFSFVTQPLSLPSKEKPAEIIEEKVSEITTPSDLLPQEKKELPSGVGGGEEKEILDLGELRQLIVTTTPTETVPIDVLGEDLEEAGLIAGELTTGEKIKKLIPWIILIIIILLAIHLWNKKRKGSGPPPPPLGEDAFTFPDKKSKESFEDKPPTVSLDQSPKKTENSFSDFQKSSTSDTFSNLSEPQPPPQSQDS